MEYKLIKPIEVNGEVMETVEYDLDELTGEDVANAVKELQKRGIAVLMNETDQNYHAMLFSIASGLAFEDVKRMKLRDYTKVCNLVRDFFLED